VDKVEFTNIERTQSRNNRLHLWMFGPVLERSRSKPLLRGIYTTDDVASAQNLLGRGDGRLGTRGSNQERYVNDCYARKIKAKTMRDGLDNTDPYLPSDEKAVPDFLEYFDSFIEYS
jgi:hypothetical protein